MINVSLPNKTEPVVQQINTTLGVNTTLEHVEIRDLSMEDRLCSWENGTVIYNPVFSKNVTLHVETEKTEGHFKVSTHLTMSPRKLGSFSVLVDYKYPKYSKRMKKMVSVRDTNVTVICVTFSGEFPSMSESLTSLKFDKHP